MKHGILSAVNTGLFLVVLAATLMANTAYANVPVGDFTLKPGTMGTGTIKFLGCSPPPVDGTRSVSVTKLTVNLTKNSCPAGNTCATGSMTVSGQASGTIAFQNIQIDVSGSIVPSGSWSSSDLKDLGNAVGPASGSFNSAGGIFSNDPLPNLNTLVFQNVGGGGSSSSCGSGVDLSAFNADLVRVTGGAVSDTSPSSAGTQDAYLRSLLRIYQLRTGGRTQTALEKYKNFYQPQYNTTLGQTNGFEVTPSPGGLTIAGQSAGEDFGYPWGVWASYQHSDFSDDFTGTAFDADTDIVFGGLDFSPWENMVAGVALGYENTDVDTTFNRGGQDIDGFSIVPYFGALISDDVGVDFDLSVDFSLGYTNVDIDQFRTVPGTTTRVTSSPGSDRLFFSGNLNANQSFGNLYVGGNLGFLIARDDLDGFTESDGTVVPDRGSQLGRLSVGANAAYAWDSFEPFVNAIYEVDYESEKLRTAVGPQPANDVNDVVLGAGLRWFSRNGVTASFEWNSVLDRTDFDSDTYTFQIRADF